MEKTIAVFGVGVGLGLSVAQKFGLQGYNAALIGRNQTKLDGYVLKLKESGVKTQVKTFLADLTNAEQLNQAIDALLKEFGNVDIVFSSPVLSAPNFGFAPATEITTEQVKPQIELLLYPSINIVQRFLPIMLQRKEGSFIFGFGSSAIIPMSGRSGPGIAAAALRNYVLTLQKEVEDKGIYVGLFTVGVLILGSAGGDAIDKFIPSSFKRMHASELAEQVWDIYVNKEPERHIH